MNLWVKQGATMLPSISSLRKCWHWPLHNRPRQKLGLLIIVPRNWVCCWIYWIATFRFHLRILIEQNQGLRLKVDLYQNVNASKVFQGAIHNADTVLLLSDVPHCYKNLKEKKQKSQEECLWLMWSSMCFRFHAHKKKSLWLLPPLSCQHLHRIRELPHQNVLLHFREPIALFQEIIETNASFHQFSHLLPWLQPPDILQQFSSAFPLFSSWEPLWLLPWQIPELWLHQFHCWHLHTKQKNILHLCTVLCPPALNHVL